MLLAQATSSWTMLGRTLTKVNVGAVSIVDESNMHDTPMSKSLCPSAGRAAPGTEISADPPNGTAQEAGPVFCGSAVAPGLSDAASVTGPEADLPSRTDCTAQRVVSHGKFPRTTFS